MWSEDDGLITAKRCYAWLGMLVYKIQEEYRDVVSVYYTRRKVPRCTRLLSVLKVSEAMHLL